MRKKMWALALGLALLCAVPALAVQGSGNLTATSADCSTAGSCVGLALAQNNGSAVVDVSGTFTATVQFEVSSDGGQHWRSITSVQPSGASSATAGGNWQFNVSGYTNIRVRCSAFTSGTAVISITPGLASAKAGGGGGASLPTDWTTSGADIQAALTGVYGWGSPPDTGLSRSAAGVVAVGNGTQGDTSGTVLATRFKGATGMALTDSGDGGMNFVNGSGGNVLSMTPSGAAGIITLGGGYSLSNTVGGIQVGSGYTADASGGIIAKYIKPVPAAFSTLAACSGVEGAMAAVNDSTTVTWGATITGGGTNHVLAYCNGTNWTVAAK